MVPSLGSMTPDFRMESDDSFEIDSALHPSLEMLQDTDLDNRIQSLEGCTTQSVMRGLSSDEFDKVLLSPALNCILEASRNTFQSIEKLENKVESVVKEKIEFVTLLLGKAEVMLTHLVQTYQGSNIRNFGSLASTFPIIIKTSIDHCQRSSKIYDAPDILNHLQNALNKLFHGIRENLILYSRLLETILKLDQSRKFLSAVLNDCVEYHDQLKDLDYKTLGITWKIFARLCKTYSSDLKEEKYDFSKSLNLLSSYAYESLLSLLKMKESDGEKKGLREAQMVSFILKIIRQQCELFPDNLVSDYKELTRLVGLILMVQFRFVDDWPIGAKEKIKHEIPSINFLIIKSLLLHPMFASHILSKTLETVEEREEQFLILLYLLEHFHKLPEDNQTLRLKWMNQTADNIFESIFRLLGSFSAVMNGKNFLCGVQYDGKPLTIVFTYEVVICRIQAFLAGLDPKNFAIVERVIFKHLFSTDFWTQMLAGDSLCFVARFGTSDLCYSHFKLLTKTYRTISERDYILEDIVRRLFSFLSDEDVKLFSKEYPFKSNIFLWSVLVSPKKKFPELSKFSESILQSVVEGEDLKRNDLNLCLKIVSKSETESSELIIKLWDQICIRAPAEDRFENVFVNLYNWTASLLPSIANKSKIFKMIQETLETFPSSRYSCAHFLTKVSGKVSDSLLDILEVLMAQKRSSLVSQRICHVVATLVNRRLISSKKFEDYDVKPIDSFDEYIFFSKPIKEPEKETQSKKRKRDDSTEIKSDIITKVVKILDTAVQNITSELVDSKTSTNEREKIEAALTSLSDIATVLFKQVYYNLQCKLMLLAKIYHEIKA